MCKVVMVYSGQMRTKYKTIQSNIRKALLTFGVLLFGLLPAAGLVTQPSAVYAEEPKTVDTGGNLNETLDSVPTGSTKNDCQDGLDQGNCGITKWLVAIINILSAAAGLIITIVIIVGGIQYTTAKDDPQAVAAAKGRITNAILALAVYIFFYAFLQWLVPGGVL